MGHEEKGVCIQEHAEPEYVRWNQLFISRIQLFNLIVLDALAYLSCCFNGFLGGIFVLNVVMVVEVRKETGEDAGFEHHQGGHGLGETAVHEHWNKTVHHKREELDDLELGNVPLPPKVGSDVRRKCGQSIIAVHDNMDSCVQDGEHCYLAGDSIVDGHPNSKQSERVMKKMEEGDMIILFESNKEDSIKKFSNLHQHIEPSVI